MNRCNLRSLRSSLIVGALMLPLAMPATAMAQSFTFKSTSNAQNALGGNGQNGVPYSGGYWTGSSSGEMADGQKTNTTFKCVMMTQPPKDSLFEAHMLCDITAANGTYSATMGCMFVNPAKQEVSCIGGLYGTSGAYEGRRGSITNHAKGSVSTGTGQWFQ